MEEEAPAGAHELGLELRRDVVETDRPGRHVVLEPLEASHEVAVDLILQERQRRLGHLRIRLADFHCEPRDIFGDELELRPNLALRRLVRRDGEATLERLEGGSEPRQIHRRRATDPNRRDQGGEILDHFELGGLVLGNEQEH